MKKIIATLAFGILLMSGCTTGIKTINTTLENNAFIELIGNPKFYPEGVEVTLNDKTVFYAMVNKENRLRNSTSYAIPTGKHFIEIKQGDELIYSKQIFVSAQETRQIQLP
jgi:hypothetical protein